MAEGWWPVAILLQLDGDRAKLRPTIVLAVGTNIRTEVSNFTSAMSVSSDFQVCSLLF